jgi:hypothetical protein
MCEAGVKVHVSLSSTSNSRPVGYPGVGLNMVFRFPLLNRPILQILAA